MEIAIEGGEVVPRSIGKSIHPRQEIWTPRDRPLGFIPIVASRGEIPIHRAQKMTRKILSRIPPPMIPRPTPIKNILMRIIPRIA